MDSESGGTFPCAKGQATGQRAPLLLDHKVTFLVLSQRGHALAFQKKLNYSGTFIFLLFSSNAMLQWPLHNGQCFFLKKKNPFQAFDFAIELNGWISSTQGNTWQCLMISIFNSRRNVPQSSRGSRVGALDCGRPAWRQERRIWKSTGGADGPARRRDC